MPPFYDIYGFSKKRDKETIENFLSFFCFRDKVECREGQEIRIYKNDKYGIDEIIIPIETLSEVVNYGINNSDHGFAFYIGDNLKRGVDEIILKFTYDGKMIYGISIEKNLLTEEGNLTDNYGKAQIIEKEIAVLTYSTKTSIQFEYPPSDDEVDFNRDIELWANMNREKRK